MASTTVRRAPSSEGCPPLLEAYGADIAQLGSYGIFASLAIIYFWFGGMKFTAYEAEGLVPPWRTARFFLGCTISSPYAAFPRSSVAWS